MLTEHLARSHCRALTGKRWLHSEDRAAETEFIIKKNFILFPSLKIKSLLQD